MEVKAPNKVDTRDEHKTQKQNILIWCNTPGIHLLGACAQSLSRVRLFVTPRNVARQASLSTGFPRQGYWSGLLFPPPEDLPGSGV